MDVYIRPAALEDAKAINDLRRMTGVMENILGLPSETVQDSENYLRRLDDMSHQFVAVKREDGSAGMVVGTVGLQVNPIPRKRHCADVGIMVHKEYQGMGIGKRLLETVIDLADNWLMLKRLELEVFLDNEKAIALYKQMGFETEGIRRKAAIRNGIYADEMLMCRIRVEEPGEQNKD